MPEAVNTWFESPELRIIERIKSVFRSIPTQLSSVYDDSVKRFKFKGVHGRKSRYAEYESAINWLHKCRLALKNHPIEGQPRSPLAAYQKEDTVKLFLFDIGFLNYMLGTSYREVNQQSYEFKGYIAENYVQQEIAALGIEPSFSWGDARAEIEFIIADDLGRIVPVEVKSGKRTRAKSLQSYIEKCAPHKTIELTGAQGSPMTETENITIPLYYSEYLLEHIKKTE